MIIIENFINLCPKCWHFMAEQEWEEEDYIDYCKKFTDTLKYQLRTELNQEDVLITKAEVEIL